MAIHGLNVRRTRARGIVAALAASLVAGQTLAEAQIAQAPAAQAPAAPTVGQAPEPQTRPPVVAPITDAVNVLTPRGRWVIEPSLQYSYSSDTRVSLVGFTIIPAITIGLIDIRNISREMWFATLTGRYGVTDRLELETRIPWVYRSDSVLARPLATPAVGDTVFDATNSGLSDVEFAARYQISQSSPYVIGFLRYKTRTGDGPFDFDTTTLQPGLTTPAKPPTGSGFKAAQAGASVLLPSDPGVFFGGFSYIYNRPRDISTLDPAGVPIGEYDPGDGFNVNFGMGLAINERASFSIGYDHSVFFTDKQNGQEVLNAQTQQIGSLLFGLSYQISPRTSFNLTLGIGATAAAPDMQLTARLPFLF